MVGMNVDHWLWDMPFGSSFRLRELLGRHGIEEFDLRKDRGVWVLDLKDGRRLKLSPQQGGAYRMVLESSGESRDVGFARLINNHFVLGQQAADELGRLLGSSAGGTTQPTASGGPVGGERQPTAGGGLVYAGRFLTDEEVLERLLRSGISGPLVPPPSAAGGQSGQQGQQGQQPSRSRSWLGELKDLLEKIGPWLILAMMLRGDQRGRDQTYVWV